MKTNTNAMTNIKIKIKNKKDVCQMPHYFSSSRVAATARMSRWGDHENVHHEFCTTKH